MTIIFKRSEQYGLTAKVLHWLLAVLMIALLAIGWRMVDLSYYDPWYHDALSLHKSLGMVVIFIVTFKLIWSIFKPPPIPEADLNRFEHYTARLVHSLLRLATLLIPVTGYLVSTSEGASIDVFGWFSFPVLLQINERARDIAIDIHYYFAYTAAALIVLHVAATVKHQFMDHKNTFNRMW